MSRDEYGTGDVRQLPSGRFQARLSIDGKRRPIGKTTFASEEEAERALAAAVEARSRLTIERGLNFAEYGLAVHKEYWEKAHRRGRDRDHSRERDDTYRWRFWIERSWPHGKLPVEALDRSHFEHLIEHLLETPGAKGTLSKNRTLRNTWLLVRRVGERAMKEGLWATDPLYKLEAPKRDDEAKKKPNPLTAREMFSVLRCPDYEPHQTCAFGLVMYSGLRAGEMARLLKTDFHGVWADDCCCPELEAEERTTPHVLVTKSWENLVTKNGEHRRVWLCQDVVPILVAWNEYLESRPLKSKRYKSNSPWFWGRQYARNYDWGWSDKYDKGRGKVYPGCKTKAGILRHVTEHHLRDTHASHLISGTFGRRWSLEEVAEQLGHSNTYVTERYGTMLDRAMAQAMRDTPGLSGQSPSSKEKFAPVIQLPVAFKAAPVSAERVQLATQLISAYDSAKDGLSDAAADEIERTALQLAEDIVGAEDVRLAQRVLAKDRLLLTHGVELARVLIRASSKPSETQNVPAEVLPLAAAKGNDGRFKRGHDDRRWTQGATPYLENRPKPRNESDR